MVRTICSVCNGRGKITKWLKSLEETHLSEVTCPNCQGEGFVGVPENFPINKSPYRTK